MELESRANTLLRKLLTLNQPQTSEAEEKWFKELTRVKSRLNGQRGLLAQAKLRVAEGRKLVELAGKKHGENEDEVGKRKLDGRVMEAIEETYIPFLKWTNSQDEEGGEIKDEDCEVKFWVLRDLDRIVGHCYIGTSQVPFLFLKEVYIHKDRGCR